MNPEIIAETPDYVVINKPAGLVVHSDARSTSLTAGKTIEKTLADWVMQNYPEAENVGEPLVLTGKDDVAVIIKRPGIVHRLDRETSGVMIVAKTDSAFEFFKKAFKDRDIEKTYHAIVWGHVKKDEDVIDAAIARSKSDFRKWSAQRGARGKMRTAVTEYKVLKRFEDGGKKFTLLELHPKTGRTHQIRVHMKYLNHPIICDSLYGSDESKPLGFNRTALHSRKIEFTDMEGEKRVFEAPYPDDFSEMISKLDNNL